MSDFSNSVSGIQAAFSKQEVSAHNLANLNTEGYKARRLQQSESTAGGVQTESIQTNDSPGPPIPGRRTPTEQSSNYLEGSNVKPSREVVSQMASEHSNAANVTALKTQNEMLGSLMDLQA